MDNLDLKIFRFEKKEICYDELSEQEKEDERRNILNGLNFARKVIATCECDFLVLDEILGLVDNGIASAEAIAEILKMKDASMHIVMTGNVFPEELKEYVDGITMLTTDSEHVSEK